MKLKSYVQMHMKYRLKILKQKEELLWQNPQSNFRGKYEIYFLEKFIEKLKSEFNTNELESYRIRKDENFIKTVQLNVQGNILSALHMQKLQRN